MTTRARIILLVLAALVLVGGIAVIGTSAGDDDDTNDKNVPSTAVATPPGETGKKAAPKARVESIRIKGGKPAGGVQTLKYDSGDTIALRFSTDKAGEVHIHGFDQEFEVTPESPKVVRFKADIEGIFEIEDHETDELLAKLEVRPK